MDKFRETFIEIGKNSLYAVCTEKNVSPIVYKKSDGTLYIEPFEEWCKRKVIGLLENMTYQEFIDIYLKDLLNDYKSKGGKVYEG